VRGRHLLQQAITQGDIERFDVRIGISGKQQRGVGASTIAGLRESSGSADSGYGQPAARGGPE
jgi:hypothetical protein